MEQERMQKEAEAREQRLATVLSRMSHQVLLTSLSLLGVALTREQSLRISKLVAAKLSALGFGTAPAAAAATSSTLNNTKGSARDTDLEALAPTADTTVDAHDTTLNAQQPESTRSRTSQSPLPLAHAAQSPPPPPPPPLALPAVSLNPDGNERDAGVLRVGSREYVGVAQVEAGWSADVVVEGTRLHLGTFSTAQVGPMFVVRMNSYVHVYM